MNDEILIWTWRLTKLEIVSILTGKHRLFLSQRHFLHVR